MSSDYIQIPKTLLLDGGIEPALKVCYMILLSTGSAASLEDIAKALGKSKNQTRRYIQALETIGWIKTIHKIGGANEYEFYTLVIGDNATPITGDTGGRSSTVAPYNFDDFWADYRKSVNPLKCEKIFLEFSEAERLMICDHCRKYQKRTRRKFRMNPLRYLQEKPWLIGGQAQ